MYIQNDNARYLKKVELGLKLKYSSFELDFKVTIIIIMYLLWGLPQVQM
jgi:hypothetical protein